MKTLTALLGALLIAEAGAALSPRAAALLAPIHDAYARIEAEQAKAPAPATDQQRLERLIELDQAGRAARRQIDLSVLPEAERKAAYTASWTEIKMHDVADQAALKAMLPAGGWFTKERYGEKGAEAAFLIVQHAVNDTALMRTTLERLEPLSRKDPFYGRQYALMYDRVALELDHKPQRYGSQVTCKAGVWHLMDLEDPVNVDARRKSVGLEETEAEYLKAFGTDRCS